MSVIQMIVIFFGGFTFGALMGASVYACLSAKVYREAHDFYEGSYTDR